MFYQRVRLHLNRQPQLPYRLQIHQHPSHQKHLGQQRRQGQHKRRNQHSRQMSQPHKNMMNFIHYLNRSKMMDIFPRLTVKQQNWIPSQKKWRRSAGYGFGQSNPLIQYILILFSKQNFNWSSAATKSKSLVVVLFLAYKTMVIIIRCI